MLEQALLTTTITIISAIIIYIVQQIIVRLFITPQKKYNQLRCEAAAQLVYYANRYSNPIGIDFLNKNMVLVNTLDSISLDLRKTAGNFYAFSESKGYSFISCINFLPHKQDLRVVVKEFIGISNSLTKSGIKDNGINTDKRRQNIEKILHIQPLN